MYFVTTNTETQNKLIRSKKFRVKKCEFEACPIIKPGQTERKKNESIHKHHKYGFDHQIFAGSHPSVMVQDGTCCLDSMQADTYKTPKSQ